ncbi:MAG TPA: N-acetyltransferase [Rhizomicrobium sp.]|jgi:putative acetyltransferase
MTPDALVIRDETEADGPAIHDVQIAAFASGAEAQLVEALRSDGDLVFSVVAVLGGSIVGHAAFSRMNAPFKALGLGPVGIVTERQGQGVGTALILAGLTRAAAANWRCIFVLGGVDYYARFGFACDAAAGFRCHYAGPHFMALALNGPLPVATGEVAYPRAFEALE